MSNVLASAAKIVAAVTKVFETIKSVVEIGRDAAPMIKIALETLKKNDLTEEDLAALESRIDALRAELHAPLPPAEPGEEG